MAPIEAPALAQTLQQLLAQHWPALALAFAAVALLQLWLAYTAAPSSSSSARRSAGAAGVFLDPAEFKPLALAAKTPLSPNVVRLRFSLPGATQRLGLTVGHHISFLAKDVDTGADVYRTYTPVSDDDLLGSVEFVIKMYPQGKMSQVISRMKVGDTMLMKGPKGRLRYEPNMKEHLGMLAGGTGITPMYQLLSAVLKNPGDRTKVSLLYSNMTEQDILLRKELDELAAAHPDRLKVHYVLSRSVPEGWTGTSGRITQALITEQLPAPGPATLVLRCGPTSMMEALKQALDAAGYGEDQQFQF